MHMIIYYNGFTILDFSCLFSKKRFEAEAVVPACSVKDGWLFWPTGVHAMKATYNNSPINDSCNKLRLKSVKVTGDKEVCEGLNFMTAEDFKEELKFWWIKD
nr:uncharacterized protein LOC124814786 [Hydra vulgaris]